MAAVAAAVGATSGDIGQNLATTPKPRNTCKLKTFADIGKLTVGEYLDRWLADSVKGTVKETTYANYAYVTQVHVSPALGGVKLKSLTPAHVRGFYGEKATIAITWTPTTTWYRHGRPHRAPWKTPSKGRVALKTYSGLRLH